MSDLRIKPNKDNGDWPRKFNGKEKPWTDTVSANSDVFQLQLMDIFNPAKIRDWLKKDNQHHNTKKE